MSSEVLRPRGSDRARTDGRRRRDRRVTRSILKMLGIDRFWLGARAKSAPPERVVAVQAEGRRPGGRTAGAAPAPPLAQAVALALERDHVGVVDEAVDEGGGDLGVADDLAPGRLGGGNE